MSFSLKFYLFLREENHQSKCVEFHLLSVSTLYLGVFDQNI